MKKLKNLMGLFFLVLYFLVAKFGDTPETQPDKTQNTNEATNQERESKQHNSQTDRVDQRKVFSTRSTQTWAGSNSWSMLDIQRPEVSDDLKPVIVAIVDTGVDIHHPALKTALWTNPGESGLDAEGRDRSSNGVDDDNNGYVDDVHGWNFADGNYNISDQHGHGTHISGIVAARPHARSHFRGVSPNAQIMVLKYFGESQSGKSQVAATIEAFRYATKMGAQIINYSAGGTTANETEQAAIERAGRRKIMLIAAAGNLSTDTDDSPYFPASYDLENILSVAGHNQQLELFDASNFGANSVDISSPGEQVYSTLPNGLYGNMSGTSQATAFVTGVAALLLGQQQPPKTLEQLKARISNTGVSQSGLTDRVASGKSLSAKRAFYMRGRFKTSGGLNPGLLELSKLRRRLETKPPPSLDWAQVIQTRNLNRAPSMEKPSQNKKASSTRPFAF
ncbi:MAG: S8 family serine peptidase [Bdellovibrionales bacterium]|nr:S8 family serine peptidase [Bdellovibrionales bacterium]